MASIPCAAYKAGHIHDHLRKQNICQQRKDKIAQMHLMNGGTSSTESTPPASPKMKQDGLLQGFFVYLNGKKTPQTNNWNSNPSMSPVHGPSK